MKIRYVAALWIVFGANAAVFGQLTTSPETTEGPYYPFNESIGHALATKRIVVDRSAVSSGGDTGGGGGPGGGGPGDVRHAGRWPRQLCAAKYLCPVDGGEHVILGDRGVRDSKRHETRVAPRDWAGALVGRSASKSCLS